MHNSNLIDVVETLKQAIEDRAQDVTNANAVRDTPDIAVRETAHVMDSQDGTNVILAHTAYRWRWCWPPRNR